MADGRRCLLCDATRPADRIPLHLYIAHRAWWQERYGPRPPAITVQVSRG